MKQSALSNLLYEKINNFFSRIDMQGSYIGNIHHMVQLLSENLSTELIDKQDLLLELPGDIPSKLTAKQQLWAKVWINIASFRNTTVSDPQQWADRFLRDFEETFPENNG